MRKESLGIAVACLLGGFFGTFTGYELALAFGFPLVFALIGMAVGAGIGYISYEPRLALAGAKRSWHETGMRRPLHVVSWILAGLSVLGIPLVGYALFEAHYFPRPEQDQLLNLWLASGICSLIATFWVGALLINRADDLVRRRIGRWHLPLAGFAILFALPIFACLFIWYVGKTCQVIWQQREEIVDFFRTTREFIRRAFRYIHSEIRTLCAVDAALGVLVAFTYGWLSGVEAPLARLGLYVLGGALGGVLGVVNFELVSVRWLKLVPSALRHS